MSSIHHAHTHAHTHAAQRDAPTHRFADAKKPTAQHAGNQDLVDVFWVLADATFKAEPENAGTKGSAYRKAAQAFAACAFAVTAETVSISGEKKLADVGKASFTQTLTHTRTGPCPLNAAGLLSSRRGVARD